MRKLIGTTTSALAVLGILSACSSSYRRPESIDEKIARYKSNHRKTNKVPALAVLDGPIPTKAKVRSRGPASVPSFEQTENSMVSFSNKRLYFLTLLSQYNRLQGFAEGSTPPQVNICPSFHTSLVNHNEGTFKASLDKKLIIGFSDNEQTLADDTYVALYPELSLPLTSESSYPRVVDMLRKNLTQQTPKQLLSQALNIHLTKTYQELSELCETGSSDNYYTYENLITLIKKQDQYGANNDSVKMLFKTTIFANRAIIYSLDSHAGHGRFPASEGENYYSEIVHRLKAQWTKGYFKKLDGAKKTYQQAKSSTKDVKPITRRKGRKDPFVFLERTKDRRS